ncbi:9169_t:CDS:1, partial [Racocetra persica]
LNRKRKRVKVEDNNSSTSEELNIIVNDEKELVENEEINNYERHSN